VSPLSSAAMNVRVLLSLLPAVAAQTNCAFGPWTDWSVPGAQPNPTTCYRIRSIATPAANGGTACSGPTGQSKTCDPNAPLSAEVLQLDTADCVLDSFLAAGFLAKASFQIMEAVAECPNTQAGCTSEISKATGSFLATGSFISSTVNSCPAIKNANAACARDIVGLLGALAGISGASASMVGTCVEITKAEASQKAIVQGARRLEYQQAPQILGKCIMNVYLSTALLGKAGTGITSSIRNCPPRGTEGPCSASVSGVLASFATVAAFLSKAASQCADTASLPALCSGDISGLIGSLSAVAQTASAMTVSCPPPGRRLEGVEGVFDNSTFLV